MMLKLLCANQAGDSWNAGVTHLIWKAIKNGRAALFCNEELARLGYWPLQFQDVL
jgi:hypothetical protein